MKMKFRKDVDQPCVLHGMHFTATADVAHKLEGDLTVEALDGKLTFKNPEKYDYDKNTGVLKLK